MKPSASQRKPAPSDRRSGADRRQVEAGPPSRHERRRSVENRQPEAIELELTDSQWGALIDGGPPAPPPATQGPKPDEPEAPTPQSKTRR